jgi:glycosyltransferase involved in cell wall biosynthesis
MPKVKIAFVIDSIASPTAGTEKQLLFLLRCLDRNKFEPYLCCLQSSQWLEKDFDICPLYIVKVKSFKHPVSFFRLWRFAKFLQKEKVDIVQTHFRDANIAGIISGKLAGVKKIISTRRNIGYWHNRLEVVILKFLNQWVAKFVANSEYARIRASKIEGIRLEKIEVIYNFLNLEMFKRDGDWRGEKLKESLGTSNECPVVTMVANLRPVKGVDVFLKSARLVLDSAPGINFIVVGEGEERKRLESICQQLKLDSSVKLIGAASDIIPLLRASDIGVLSSNSESLSNAIIEYMAAGLPVICTDVGGNRELVQDGLNGFLVPSGDPKRLADAIVRLVNDPELRLRMGRESRQRVKLLFDFEKAVKDYEAFYMKLAS